MKTIISSLAITAAIFSLSACTKSQLPIPTDPNVDAPHASRQLDTNQHIETSAFPAAPVEKPRVDIRP